LCSLVSCTREVSGVGVLKDMGVGELGVAMVIAYVAGHFMPAVGNGV
jgi:hypothetical protein